jgi:hypothetical protein
MKLIGVFMKKDLKNIINENFIILPDNTSVKTTLTQVKEGEWELARKSEYKRDVFSLDDNTFIEVCFSRHGNYHTEYVYLKPEFSIVLQHSKKEISYTEIKSLKSKAEELKNLYFNDNDTDLKEIYSSGWKKADKVNYFDTVYEVDGLLLKQTLYGNSDWTELVDYSIVEKNEKIVVNYYEPSLKNL